MCPAAGGAAQHGTDGARRRAAVAADRRRDTGVSAGLAVRVAVDAALAAQAQLPTFEAWRQQQETCG